MNPLLWPWLEIAVFAPALMAPPVAFVRDKQRALRLCTAGCAVTFTATFFAWLAHYLGATDGSAEKFLNGAAESTISFGHHPMFRIDELSAPLLPAIALLHLLMAMTTSKWKAESFGAARYLASLSLRLATFACFLPHEFTIESIDSGWLLIVLSLACTVPSYFDLKRDRKSTTVYLLHMLPFAMLLTIGWLLVDFGNRDSGAVFLIFAVLIRSGVFPAHVWILDLIENGSFSSSVLMITPMLGVYIAVRLTLPIAPPWLLTIVTLISLATAVYCSCMAVVQTDTRRFFAHLYVSFASLVLVGLEMHTDLSVTGALALWFSIMLSAGGLTVVLRAVEARHGRLSLDRYHGIFDRSPMLSIGFLITGLACVGFPGTLGFVSAELLIDGTLESNLWIGIVIIFISALNGIAVMRAYWVLFTGKRQVGTTILPLTWAERTALLVLAFIIFGGGLYPQPGMTSRYEASKAVVKEEPPTGH